jgi:hypothetical protein
LVHFDISVHNVALLIKLNSLQHNEGEKFKLLTLFFLKKKESY